jgi:UDP-GlcNAc3NAcA epimerase
MYDASIYYRQKITKKHHNTDFILLTIHRAENTDDASKLMAIAKALNKLSDYRFIFPAHPRTRKILHRENIKLASHIELIEPIGYFEMLELESSCTAIVTDSGGVQKEAYFFKKPCITLRDSTEWVELVNSGWNTLAGANAEKIIFSIHNLQIPSEYPAFYGDGNSAKKIIDSLKYS